MIAKGNLHGDGGKLARYLLTGDPDEIAELVETRGLDYLGSDPVQAFKMLQRVAEANTKAESPFFHSQTRLAPNEHLTDAQWLQIADREEKRLGLTGQPRIVSFHVLANGEKHLHVGWYRIDLETMRAIDPGLYKNHLKHLCRSLEKEYGLKEVSNVRKPEDRARPADRKEVEESRRLGTDVRAIRATILDCFERTDGGKAFSAALAERGLILSNGDRRDCFVVIDQAGGQHALNKKLTGLTLAAMRDRLGDLDRGQLPSVDQAQMQQREKYPAPEFSQQHDASRAQPDPARPTDPERVFKPEERHPAYAHYPAPSGAARPEADAAATREQERATAPAQPTPGEPWHQRPVTKTEEKIIRIQEAADRGGPSVAAGLHAEGLTLARVDAAGKAAIDREYRRQYENAKLAGNEDARLRRASFKDGELVAVNRYGDVHRLNPRLIDRERLERAVTGGSDKTPTLSSAQEHFATERRQVKDDRAAARETVREAKQTQRDRDQFAQGIKQGVKGAIHDLKGTDKGFKVVDGKGAVTSLAGFMENLFGMGAAPSSPDHHQQQRAPQGGRGEDASEAWEEIYESIQRGNSIPADSIRHLPPSELENLRRHGDAHIDNKIRDMEREKEDRRDQDDYDYARERMGRER